MRTSFKKKINIYKKILFTLIEICFFFIWNLLNYKKQNNKQNKENNENILICRNQFYSISLKDVSMEYYHLDANLKNYDISISNFYWDTKNKSFTNLINLYLVLLKNTPKIVVLSSYAPNYEREMSQPNLLMLFLYSTLI